MASRPGGFTIIIESGVPPKARNGRPSTSRLITVRSHSRPFRQSGTVNSSLPHRRLPMRSEIVVPCGGSRGGTSALESDSPPSLRGRLCGVLRAGACGCVWPWQWGLWRLVSLNCGEWLGAGDLCDKVGQGPNFLRYANRNRQPPRHDLGPNRNLITSGM
jgi:hypothetical protein